MATKVTPAAAKGSATAKPNAAVELDGADLPAFCPNKRMTIWNQHPRVFLDVTTTGQAACPYCGTQYRLKPGAIVKGH
jgi:uncharacterized Zn-finger protein